jgi:hypothetical protein
LLYDQVGHYQYFKEFIVSEDPASLSLTEEKVKETEGLQPQDKQKEINSGGSWLDGIADIAERLDRKYRFPVVIVLGILAALIPIALKVKPDQLIWIWFLTVMPLLLYAISYSLFSSRTRKELNRLKEEQKQWTRDKEILTTRIASLRRQHNQLEENNNYKLSEINQKIQTVHVMIENSEKPGNLIKQLIEIANSIENQMAENTKESLGVRDGIDAVVNAEKYGKMMLSNVPDSIKSKKIKRER